MPLSEIPGTWVCILDRTNGKPLLGIEEKEVPQESRQNTAATQPYPKGDAFVPQMIAETIEGVTLINEGRIFTPFWKEGVMVRPSTFGGANWPPSSYDPSTHRLHICANDRIAFLRGGEEVVFPPPPGGGRRGVAAWLVWASCGAQAREDNLSSPGCLICVARFIAVLLLRPLAEPIQGLSTVFKGQACMWPP